VGPLGLEPRTKRL